MDFNLNKLNITLKNKLPPFIGAIGYGSSFFP